MIYFLKDSLGMEKRGEGRRKANVLLKVLNVSLFALNTWLRDIICADASPAAAINSRDLHSISSSSKLQEINKNEEYSSSQNS